MMTIMVPAGRAAVAPRDQAAELRMTKATNKGAGNKLAVKMVFQTQLVPPSCYKSDKTNKASELDGETFFF